MRIVVDADRRVVEATVLSGPGHGLDDAAREAIRKFRFAPALKDGAPVRSAMQYRVQPS